MKLEDGILKFYLLPIPPIVFQSIKLSEISDYSVKNSSLSIIHKNGIKARANLYAVNKGERETLLRYIENFAHIRKASK